MLEQRWQPDMAAAHATANNCCLDNYVQTSALTSCPLGWVALTVADALPKENSEMPVRMQANV